MKPDAVNGWRPIDWRDVFGDDAACQSQPPSAPSSSACSTSHRSTTSARSAIAAPSASSRLNDVNTEDGTGLVHMAPAYGEADFYALSAAGLDVLVDPVDMEGRFTEAVPDVAGQNVKEADKTLDPAARRRGPPR